MKITLDNWIKNLKRIDESSINLGLSKKVSDKAKSKDAIDNVSQIKFEDPEVEKICHEHGVYTYDDAREVTSIQDWFKENRSITSFGEFKYFTGLTSIGYQEFFWCKSLQLINIPSSVTSIGDSAFWCCKSLQSVTIPDSVTSIKEYAFYNCESLKSINIPDSVTSIIKFVFFECASLKTIVISKNCPVYDTIKKEYPDIQLVDKSVNESFIGEKDKAEVNITNSQGQDTIEPGKHSENVYLSDCPFLLGKEQVDWFQYFQQERDKHTIKDVDDFIESAKKDTKLIKESALGLAKKIASNAQKKDAIENLMSFRGDETFEDIQNFIETLIKTYAKQYNGIEVHLTKGKVYGTDPVFKYRLCWKEYQDKTGNVFRPEMVILITSSDIISWSQGGVCKYFKYEWGIPVGLIVYANFRICTNPDAFADDPKKMGFNDRKIEIIDAKQIDSEDIQQLANVITNTCHLAQALDSNPDLYPQSWSKKEYEKLVNNIQSYDVSKTLKVQTDNSFLTQEEMVEFIDKKFTDADENIQVFDLLMWIFNSSSWIWHLGIAYENGPDITSGVLSMLERGGIRKHEVGRYYRERQEIMRILDSCKGQAIFLRITNSKMSQEIEYKTKEFLKIEEIFKENLPIKYPEFDIIHGLDYKFIDDITSDSLRIIKTAKKDSQEAARLILNLVGFMRRNRKTLYAKQLTKNIRKELSGKVNESSVGLGLSKKVSDEAKGTTPEDIVEDIAFGDVETTIKKIKLDLIDRAPESWYVYNDLEDVTYIQFISPSFDGYISSSPIGVIHFDFSHAYDDSDRFVLISSSGDDVTLDKGDNSEVYKACMSEFFNATETFVEEDPDFEESIKSFGDKMLKLDSTGKQKAKSIISSQS